MTDYFAYEQIIKCIDTGEICKGYKEYLKSMHWQHMKTAAWLLSKKCIKCGSRYALQVHHVTYDRLGCEDYENDLIILCKQCHGKEHGRKSSPIGNKKKSRKEKITRDNSGSAKSELNNKVADRLAANRIEYTIKDFDKGMFHVFRKSDNMLIHYWTKSGNISYPKCDKEIYGGKGKLKGVDELIKLARE